MADLKNALSHMVGKGVLVNGTRYQIDNDGVARGVNEEDALKLLKNDAWRRVGRSPAPKISSPPATPAKPPVVEETAPEAPAAVTEDEDDGSWPDPDMGMGIEYLQEMADAYEVSYTKRTGKKKLVTLIMAAMYPDE